MHPTIEFDADLIARMTQRGPRYTSYPTADRFTPAFGAGEFAAAARPGKPLSLYVHIPFCESLCYYCACNKIITHDRGKAVKYLGYLLREIDMQAALFADGAVVEQLHFGGGTPTYLSDAQMGDLLGHLRSRYTFASDDAGEFSIEIDPRTVDAARIRTLRRQGFNRLSLGVQDFDEDVQRAVNRIQPEALTRDAIAAAREAGFRSISIDLIYGLPLQDVTTMAATLDKVVAAAPDRISVYNYAHMPQLFKSQKLIRDEDLPDGATKLAMLGLCIERLGAAGYVYIGMDHFARPDDELARAQRDGTLHRNFQGYSTHADIDMVACGVSAISAVNGTYAQNEKSLERYYTRIDRGELPVARGLALSGDDLLRREVIQKLMCDFALDLRDLAASRDVDVAARFAPELARLADLARDGLLAVTPDRIDVTPKGRLLVRNICMVFDDYFGKPAAVPLQRMQYSRTV
ncbi:coproporphyrinogen III oxidase [Massilia sp. Root133]|uniref:Coproporphyrinogen-III oxidase n=1 Tax=Massilia cellulosiltytica TaxID=2683234 RepID=A0A7X3FX85_9BURK|nr:MULTISPECIES: oxygen-independent coproporphyrinogen III oxidase [Telluria group]KQY16225.1 coproporphyrinogen III oxidase [Massilia sp. Root133]KQZ46834.1 coproporphyrinogen III oxidase [Massilia sp. Root1485]MVW59715.1 oxygen-independent coproporphyrinogen III oxidase [Telluria cellulosilytica]